MDYKIDQKNSLAGNSVVGFRLRGPNVHKYDHDAAVALGHSPAIPRWSPRFRGMSAVEADEPSVVDDDARAREWDAAAKIDDALFLDEGLQRQAGADWKSEALKQIPRGQYHPDTIPNLRFPRRSILALMMVRFARRCQRSLPLRRLSKTSAQSCEQWWRGRL